jgi:hypothetical protein
MSAAIHNLVIDQGADWKINLVYKDSTGDIIPLTSYTAALQLRASYNSATAALSLANGSGITITEDEGLIAIRATATQTGALAAGDYVYDLEVTVSGEVTRLIQGRVTVRPQVTR